MVSSQQKYHRMPCGRAIGGTVNAKLGGGLQIGPIARKPAATWAMQLEKFSAL